MKKVMKILVDCPTCAMKIENAVKKLDGVRDAKVNFLAEKLTLELDDGIDLNLVLENVRKTAKRIEPDCEIK